MESRAKQFAEFAKLQDVEVAMPFLSNWLVQNFIPPTNSTGQVISPRDYTVNNLARVVMLGVCSDSIDVMNLLCN